MIHNISGKQSTTKVQPLHVNNNDVSDVPGIAHALGQTFSANSANSSSQQYNANFQSFRAEHLTGLTVEVFHPEEFTYSKQYHSVCEYNANLRTAAAIWITSTL